MRFRNNGRYSVVVDWQGGEMTIFGIRIAKVKTLEEERQIAVTLALLQKAAIENSQRQALNQESFWDFLIDREHEQYPLGRFHA
jgi:hypothetical protein